MTAKSFHQVAQRLFATATNLLASGLVLIVGVVLGRQLLESWNSQPSTELALRLDNHGDPLGQSVRLKFGESAATFLRSEIPGDVRNAMFRLRHDCRAAADTAISNVVPTHTLTSFPKWLAQLERQPAVEKKAEKWLLHERETPLPMVVVVSDSVSASPDQENGSHRRVLSWGLAFPADSNPPSTAKAWTLFTVIPASTEQTPVMSVELPRGCDRLVALDGNDGLLIGFASNMEPEELTVRWDEKQRVSGWQIASDWQVTPTGWHRHYNRPTGETYDVQFGRESDSQVLGFCLTRKVGH